MELSFSRTRFAPTPSGYLHLGNIYSFAVTSAFAQKANANIFLRIDDADMARTDLRYVQDIFDTLDFLEIPWQEGPRNIKEYQQEYSQVHRMGMYQRALNVLRDNDLLFACKCSRTDVLRLNKESIYSGTCLKQNICLDVAGVSWRMKTDPECNISIKTTNGVIETKLPDTMKNFIVRKKDGFPAYQLTSIVDDCYYGVDFIIRGADLWPSSVAQVWLSKHCGMDQFSDVLFYHHPLFVDETGNKLSKSEGATSVYYLRQRNKSPQDIYRLIALHIGVDVSPKSWQELLSLINE